MQSQNNRQIKIGDFVNVSLNISDKPLTFIIRDIKADGIYISPENEPNKISKIIQTYNGLEIFGAGDTHYIIEFYPKSISQLIIFEASNDEIGDIFESRLDLFLVKIAHNIRTEGNKDNVNSEYRDYRCWDLFNFDKSYTWHEYAYKWMGSLYDLAGHNIGKGLYLVCELKLNDNEVRQIINEVFPSLKSGIKNRQLVINLDEIAKNSINF